MKVALTAFTRRGAALAERLAGIFSADGHPCALAVPEKLAGELGQPGYGRLGEWTGERFRDADALVFVGASGIAVRAIAPYVKDKFTDPAVVSMDEAGRFAVPLLSGHVGGANDLARYIAEATGATAVISTATDVNSLWAVDEWAVKHGLVITDRKLAKEISAALLAGERVGFASDLPVPCPPGLYEGRADLGVWITCRSSGGPFPRTLRLVPRCLTLGIGCRKGTEEAAIRTAVEKVLSGWDLAAVRSVASIDLKAEEPGLLAFCAWLGVPLTTYTAEELQAAKGEFTPSKFVQSVTGVDNVCERAAVLGGGRLVVPKEAGGGVTVAVAMLPTNFEE